MRGKREPRSCGERGGEISRHQNKHCSCDRKMHKPEHACARARACVCVCARAYIRVTLCLFIVARWEGSAITGVKVENLVGLK